MVAVGKEEPVAQESRTRRAQRELDALLTAAREINPGIFDLLKVYGGYEEAVRQAAAYLALLKVPPQITTSNRSLPNP